jgi:biotin carboxyl carrier protein
MKYFANSENHEYEFSLEETASGYIVSDAESNQRDVEIRVLDEHRYSLLIKKESYIIKSEHSGDSYNITIRGKNFDIEVNTEKSKLWKKIIAASSDKATHGKIKSPMPGLLVKYLVTEGEKVEKGQSIYILSAMKMENEIKSDFSGVISTKFIEEGQAVEKGQEILLIL